ncbi:MAG: metal ABC transporter ATP-binding protein [Anaerolineae bacterium]|nr:metal ABC transporter ATP-binding protein [Thermoflexales bacterium]MDW8396273.1 metal ABC transporter ATP-binding protein [Anaerolineae bacterium]
MIVLAYGKRRTARAVQGAPAIEIVDLRVRYPGSDRLALDGVSLSVSPGARVALVGPNGAGKSTLLKTVAGLLPVSSGHIALFGHPLEACRHQVAYLAQRSDLDWGFPISVRKLVMTGRYPRLGWLRLPSREDWRAVDEALARVQLSDLAERQIGELSGGQQQRALLARALVQEAAVLLLDEPLNAVDATTRQVVADVLASLAAQGKAVLVATHDLDRVQAEFDDALFLLDGRPIARGVPDTVRRLEQVFGEDCFNFVHSP